MSRLSFLAAALVCVPLVSSATTYNVPEGSSVTIDASWKLKVALWVDASDASTFTDAAYSLTNEVGISQSNDYLPGAGVLHLGLMMLREVM